MPDDPTNQPSDADEDPAVFMRYPGPSMIKMRNAWLQLTAGTVLQLRLGDIHITPQQLGAYLVRDVQGPIKGNRATPRMSWEAFGKMAAKMHADLQREVKRLAKEERARVVTDE